MDKYFYTDNLESERLVTRFLTPEHSLAWAEFFENAEAVAYLPDPGFPTTIARAEDWMEKQLNRYANRYYGLQALYDKKSNVFIGQCGLMWQIVDNEWEVEVGYHIFREYWDKGYATEAAKLFMDFAFKHDLSDNIISIINVKNMRSQRVAEKNGLKREKETQWNSLDVIIYRTYKTR